jgi:hypothetical protein
MSGKNPCSVTHSPLPIGSNAVKKCCTVAKAKKKEKQGTAVTTDDGASTMPINYAETMDAMLEMAFELDKQVVPSSKAKVPTHPCHGAIVEAVPQGI